MGRRVCLCPEAIVTLVKSAGVARERGVDLPRQGLLHGANNPTHVRSTEMAYTAMNDAMRIYYGAKSIFGGESPYKRFGVHGPKASENPRQPGRKTPAAPLGSWAQQQVSPDQFVVPEVRASLHHHRCSFAPVDVGVPKLDDDDADAFAPPPLDLDELAACAGQSRIFGPIVGRAIMAAGSYFAVYATVAAAKALRQDALTLDELQQTRDRLPKASHSPAMSALRKVFGEAISELAQARVANLMLLPGALGMSVNLLGSAELFGGFFPLLQPIAAFAMGPAAICMALYGGFIAITSMVDYRVSVSASGQCRRAERPAAASPQLWRNTVGKITDREHSKQRWDLALAISGVLQAIGALLQWLIGPIWLLALLPGTVGLLVFKLLRVKSLGQQTVSPRLDASRMDAPVEVLAQRYVRTSQQVRLLRGLHHQNPADVQALRATLAQAAEQGQATIVQERLQRAAPSAQQEAEDYVAALAALGVFPYLALEVARSLDLPRTASATEVDGPSYIITGQDIVHLVQHAAPEAQQGVLLALRRVVRQVACSYGIAVARQQESLYSALIATMLQELAEQA